MFNLTKKLILVLLVVQLNLNSCYSQVALYGQCGGIGYTGSTTCISSTCYVQNPYYSQCLTSCPSGWSCVATTAQSVTQGSNTVTVALYGQCGGMGYSGSTVCASGSTCFIQTIYYSQCLTSCPAGWACQSNNPTTTIKPATTSLLTTLAKTTTTTVKPASTTVKPTTTTVKPATTTAKIITTSNSQVTVPLYGQCGGTGYTGSTVCATGYTCYVQSQYYSQCLSSCPSGWACQPSNPTTLPASTSSNGPTVSTSPGTQGPTLAPSALFPKCQFRYGRDYAGDSIDYSAYDYITIWIDTISSNCPGSNSGNPDCTNFNPWYQGAMLAKTKALNKIAVFYAYIIAFEARNLAGLQDCNVGSPSLCQYGAQFIRNNRARIIERYNNHSANIASYLGSTYTCIFLIEPDFWQYYGDPSQNGGTLSGTYMRQLYDDIGMTIKKNLPNALISWDISAWIGQSGMTTWWSYFQTSPYVDFINTSGGQSHGELTQIVPNELSWSFMSSLTGRKIIADSGYGVAGGYSDNRAPWYVQSNVDARIADGVISVTLSNSNQNPTYKPKLC